MDKLRFIFETDDLVDKIRGELEREPADLVVFDTFGDLFQGNLNDSIAVRQYLMKYRALVISFECLFLFNHHIGKGKEKHNSPSKNDVLGSQGIESASRVVLDLRKADQGRRILTVTKGNNIPDEIKNHSITLGFDTVRGFWRIESGTAQPVAQEMVAGASVDEERVMLYYDKHGSSRNAADELTNDGHPIGKTKVAEIVKKLRPSAPDPKE